MQALLCNFFWLAHRRGTLQHPQHERGADILVKQAVAGFNFQPSQSATWYDTDKPILFTTWNRQLSQLGLSNFHNLDSPISSTVEMENMVQWSNFVIWWCAQFAFALCSFRVFILMGKSSGATAQRFELVVSSLAYMVTHPKYVEGTSGKLAGACSVGHVSWCLYRCLLSIKKMERLTYPQCCHTIFSPHTTLSHAIFWRPHRHRTSSHMGGWRTCDCRSAVPNLVGFSPNATGGETCQRVCLSKLFCFI